MATPSKQRAREQIVQAANRHKLRVGRRYGVTAQLFSGRHIHQAVFMCRQNRLVKPDVLVAAGFRPSKRGER